MLAIESLRLRLPGFELGPLDLEVRDGEHFVLLGPSGAGKTTLLECIAGFRRPAEGRILLGGNDCTTLPPRARALAMVYQQPNLFPHLDVAANLGFALELGGWGRERAQSRIDELARMLQLERLLRAWPETLSHGEARRVALGRAIAAGSKLLLLDEPLEGLDPPLRRQLRLEIVALQRRLGLTIVQVTHHLDEAMAMADRIGVLLDGRLEQTGAPETLIQEPANARVARVLMVPNYLEGTADPGAGVIRLDDGHELPAPITLAGRVRARFEGVTVRPGDDESHGVPAWLRGIERREGARLAVVALHQEPRRDELLLQAELTAMDAPRPGDRVRLDFSAARWQIR